jgi:hypothetical protein
VGGGDCMMKCFIIYTHHMGFQVLMAASVKITTFWNNEPCNLVEVDCHFGGSYCLHHQDALAVALMIGSTHL